MSIKLEIGSYDTSALKHIGAALVAIAEDMENGHSREKELYADRAECACAKGPVPACNEVITDTPAIAAPFTSALGAPPVPATVYEQCAVGVPAPPLPNMDDDDSWPTTPGTPTTELDAAGIPWDVRIHAGSRTRLKADNTWKLKPGIDKALVDQVKAELLGVQSVVVVPAPPAPTLADAVAVSVTLQAPPAPVVTGPANFAELIKEVTTRISGGSMTADQVNGAVSQVTGGQLTMCNQLAARQDLIPAVWSVLCPTVG